MKSLALLRHELRNARSSLLTSACLTLALLAILHVFGGTPTESATALPLLWSLCGLQFASDSFATDLASGRLATRAALPVSARALWVAKLACFVASIACLVGAGIAVESTWQIAREELDSVRTFFAALPPLPVALGAFALIGATGMLCSLVVESALVAMLLSTLVLGALVGLWFALESAVQLMGESFLHEHTGFMTLLWTGLFLAIGWLAFTRAQRKLGDAALRVRVVLISSLVVTLGFAGTVAAASWHWTMYGLEDPSIQIFPPVASPDGRFIAFEAQPILPARFNRMESVWIVDLESGEHRLLAGPGFLPRNYYSGGSVSWSESDGLRVLANDKWDWSRVGKGMTLRVVDGQLSEGPLAGVDAESLSIRKLPEWASVTDKPQKRPGKHSVHIQWNGTEFERAFEGRIGIDIAISPSPGRVFVRRDQTLVMIDLSRDAELVLIPHGAERVYMRLSPDMKALLVRTESRETYILSAVDGSLLHAPWTRDDSYLPGWIMGDDRSHMLHLSPCKRDLSPRVLDLDSGEEIEIADNNNEFFARVADRGYVTIDVKHNLVLLDRTGQLIKVLISRGT